MFEGELLTLNLPVTSLVAVQPQAYSRFLSMGNDRISMISSPKLNIDIGFGMFDVRASA